MGKRKSKEKFKGIVFALVFLTGCSTTRGASFSDFHANPPSEALVKCPKIPNVSGSEYGDLSVWSGEMIDIYSSCAIRHHKLIEWVEGLK